MSSPGTPNTSSLALAQNWPMVANDVVLIVSALASFVSPSAAPAIAIATKIIQGAIALEPAAVALVEQIKAGTPPTPEQLQAFTTEYEADYQKLHQDILTQLAALPPA